MVTVYSVVSVGVAIGGYAIYDYQKRHQKEEWNPTPLKERENAGRFGDAFPMNKDDYKRAQKKQITLEELEWNIKDRERQYRQYLQEQGLSKS